METINRVEFNSQSSEIEPDLMGGMEELMLELLEFSQESLGNANLLKQTREEVFSFL